jgi:hypothetical protein
VIASLCTMSQPEQTHRVASGRCVV